MHSAWKETPSMKPMMSSTTLVAEPEKHTPPFFSGREFYPHQWMTPQCPHSFFKHPIDRTATNGRGESKNHAKMFISHRATQMKKKQSDIPLWTQWRWPSARLMLRHVLQVKQLIHKHHKGTLDQSCEMKKGRFVEILPRRFLRWKNCQPEKVMAVPNIIIILQQ